MAAGVSAPSSAKRSVAAFDRSVAKAVGSGENERSASSSMFEASIGLFTTWTETVCTASGLSPVSSAQPHM